MAERPHLTKDDARAGASTHVTRYVLSFSLVAVVILFAILLILYR